MRRLTVTAMMFLAFISLSVNAQEPVQSFSYPVKNVAPADIQRWNGFYYLQDTALDPPGNWYLCGDVFHPGWDINYDGDAGSSVYPVADGVVYAVEASNYTAPLDPNDVPNKWNAILIKHNIGGTYYYSAYGHMSSVDVVLGQPVIAGETKIGTLGSIGTGSDHLHLEIRQYNHPSVYENGAELPFVDADMDFWNCSTSSTNGLHNSDFVSSYYYNPELFIKGFPAVGMTETGYHEAYSQFLSVYLSSQGSINESDPWDEYQNWDQVVDRGHGVHVHTININGFSVDVQDFQRPDGTYYQLVYNPNDDKVYSVNNQILAWWKFHADEVGYPINNEVIGNYAGGMAGVDGENVLTVQAFHHTKTGSQLPVNTVTFNDNNGNPILGHHPVGRFSIFGPVGEQYYYEEQGDPGSMNHWPKLGKFTPTKIWWTDAASYNFYWIDTNSQKRDLLAHEVTEGNDQDYAPGDPSVLAPINIQAANIQESSVDLTWNDGGNPSGVTYNVYDVATGIITYGLTTTSYTVSNLQSSTLYVFEITSVVNGVESARSNQVSATTLVPVSNTGWLSVTSSPTGAEVTLNETRWPNASTTTNIPATSLATGSYTLRVTKSGYEPIEQSITVSAGQTVSIDETLTLSSTQPVGDYLFTAEPYAVHFKVWDTDYPSVILFQNDTPFAQHVGFQADTLAVEYTKADYTTWDTTFAVVNGDYKEIHGRLSYAAGTPTPDIAVDSTVLDLGSAYASLQTGTVAITNTGTARLYGTVSATGNIVSSVDSFEVLIGYSLPVNVSVNLSALAPGSYIDSLAIVSDGGSEVVYVNYVLLEETGSTVFTDDFNRSQIGSDWDIGSSGNNVEMIDNQLSLTGDGSINGQALADAAGELEDCSVEFDLNPTRTTGNRVSWVFLRYTDDNNYYRLSSWRSSNLIYLDKMVAGTRVRVTASGKSLGQGRYHFAVINDTVHFYNVNGAGTEVYLTLTDNTLGPVPAGYAGFSANEEDLFIDNVVIVDLDTSTTPGTQVLAIPDSLDLGTATSGILADSLLFQSQGTAPIVGTISTTGALVMDSSSVNLYANQGRYYHVNVNLDSLNNGSFVDTVTVSYGDTSVSTIVTYEKTTTGNPNLIAQWNMAGTLASIAKRTNEVTQGLLTETAVNSGTGLNSTTDGAYVFTKSTWSRLLTDVGSQLNGLAQFSFEAWVKFDNPNNNVIMGRNNEQVGIEWQSSNGKIYIFVGSAYGYTGNMSRTTGDWYHVAFTFNGNGSGNSGKTKVYVNGAQQGLTFVGTIPSSFPSAGSEPMILGYYKDQNAGTSCLGGAMTMVRVWNVERSSAEVSQSYSNGLAKRNMRTASVSEIPETFQLYQNYPNPFNPITTIRYDVPKDGMVEIRILDILGRNVETLINQPVAAGQYAIEWDASSLPSGLYVCQMRAGQFIETRKLVLLK